MQTSFPCTVMCHEPAMALSATEIILCVEHPLLSSCSGHMSQMLAQIELQIQIQIQIQIVIQWWQQERHAGSLPWEPPQWKVGWEAGRGNCRAGEMIFFITGVSVQGYEDARIWGHRDGEAWSKVLVQVLSYTTGIIPANSTTTSLSTRTLTTKFSGAWAVGMNVPR